MGDTPDTGQPVLTPGERLKLARELAGLSVDKVAKDLYLDAQAINAIESNRFKDLGAPVYAKGYLKKYARLVGVSEAEVLLGYQSMGDVTVVADPIPVAMGSVPESRRPLPRWILWVVAGLVGVAVVAILSNLRTQTVQSNRQGELISQPISAPGSPLEALDSPGAVTLPATGKSAVPSAAANTNTPLALRFRFVGNSWVEVYDANNQQVLYDMGTTNSTRDITATPPLRVVLGLVSAVNLQVNSQAVTVPAARVEDGIARFTLNADGTVQ